MSFKRECHSEWSCVLLIDGMSLTNTHHEWWISKRFEICHSHASSSGQGLRNDEMTDRLWSWIFECHSHQSISAERDSQLSSSRAKMAAQFENSDGKALLQRFICTYKGLPELCDVCCDSYMKKDKKNAAYEQLLIVVHMQHSSSLVSHCNLSVHGAVAD